MLSSCRMVSEGRLMREVILAGLKTTFFSAVDRALLKERGGIRISFLAVSLLIVWFKPYAILL